MPAGNLVVVPVNLASGNAANSGGLTNATIGINYDASKLSLPNGPADVTEGSLNTAAGWTNFTVNTNAAGKIVITTSNTGGADTDQRYSGGIAGLYYLHGDWFSDGHERGEHLGA